MNTVTGILVYIMLWWVVFFAVLPWGVRALETPEPGMEHGAPDKPQLWLKAGVTTVISAILWMVYYAVFELEMFS